MPKSYDLLGKVFGSLKVIEFSHSNKHKSKCWKCICKCGKSTIVDGSALRSNKTKSCGCERKYHGTKNMMGKKLGKLKVIEFSHYEKKCAYWKCLCDCGNICTRNGKYMRDRDTKSCGCIPKYQGKHNKSNTRIYWIWNGMIRRCTEINNKKYSRYGGRGIKVCGEWLEFENFYKDMGEKPKGKSLDRINNNGNYCKENCRWTDLKTQMNNTNRTKYLIYNGEKIKCKEFFEMKNISNITYKGFLNRLKIGKSIDYSLSTPSACRS